jgi:hypothetical protein
MTASVRTSVLAGSSSDEAEVGELVGGEMEGEELERCSG